MRYPHHRLSIGCQRQIVCAAFILCSVSSIATVCGADEAQSDRTSVVVVVGAPGNAMYKERFQQWEQSWKSLAEQSKADYHSIGLRDAETSTGADLDLVRGVLRAHHDRKGDLLLVFIGHGSWDHRDAKFMLRGPDLTAEELNNCLQPLQCRVAVLNCSSSSGAFVKKISRSGRVVVTATARGDESQATRFGEHIVVGLQVADADRDHDGQNSLLEAAMYAERQTRESYEAEGLLVTEHSILDDSGDGEGSSLEGHPGPASMLGDSSPADGLLAARFVLLKSEAEKRLLPEQLTERDRLILAIRDLNKKRESLPEDQYLDALEGLCLQLAETLHIDDSVDAAGANSK